MDPKKIPLITRELIEYLDRHFPDKCPSINDSERQIWIDVGKRLLVNHLRVVYERQNQTVT